MNQLVEGSVVICPNKAKLGGDPQVTGTVVGFMRTENGREIMVLDTAGFLHICAPHEAYLSQE